MTASLQFVSDEYYEFQASLSLCTVPARPYSLLLIAIICSAHIAILIVNCVYTQSGCETKCNTDPKGIQQTSANIRVKPEVQKVLLHNFATYTWVSSLLILVAHTCAIISVVHENKWFGLVSVLFVALVSMLPISLFCCHLVFRMGVNTIRPQLADPCTITTEFQHTNETNEGTEMTQCSVRVKGNTTSVSSKSSDVTRDTSIRVSNESRFHSARKYKDSKASTNTSLKSSVHSRTSNRSSAHDKPSNKSSEQTASSSHQSLKSPKNTSTGPPKASNRSSLQSKPSNKSSMHSKTSNKSSTQSRPSNKTSTHSKLSNKSSSVLSTTSNRSPIPSVTSSISICTYISNGSMLSSDQDV